MTVRRMRIALVVSWLLTAACVVATALMWSHTVQTKEQVARLQAGQAFQALADASRTYNQSWPPVTMPEPEGESTVPKPDEQQE